MICWPNARRRIAVPGQFRVLLDHAEDVALRRVGIHAHQQVGAAEMEERERMALHKLGMVDAAGAASAPVRGLRPPASHRRPWRRPAGATTGQMPQMRAVMEGISWKGRPSQNFSKPRICVTWKLASATLPFVVKLDGDPAVPFDPRHGSIVIVLSGHRWPGRLRSRSARSVSDSWFPYFPNRVSGPSCRASCPRADRSTQL